MPTKPLDRLMFAQGGLCFFCAQPLPKAEASVEHLVASARGGSNGDDNCVACCKSINTLMGSMSLKEKIKVVLNQHGRFKCPNGGAKPISALTTPKPKPQLAPPISSEVFQAIVDNLKGRGKAKPRTQKTLVSTIKSLKQLALDDTKAMAMIDRLKADKKIVIEGTKVTYKL